MLASGAHIALDGNEFDLDESLVGQQYLHVLADAQTFFSTQEAGPRVSHANLFHNVRYQYMSNWTAGEGNVSWGTDPDNDGYDQGNLNTRIPGRLQLPPARADNDVHTSIAYDSLFPINVNAAHGTLYAGPGGGGLYYSTNGTTWTACTGVNDTPVISTASDGPFLYEWIGTGPVYRRSSPTVAPTQMTSGADTTFRPKLATAVGTLYLWDGISLIGYDTTTSSGWPLVYSAGKNQLWSQQDSAASTAPNYVDIVNANNTVVMMSAWNSDTRIYSWSPDPSNFGSGAGQQMWKMPEGFTGHAMCFQAGLVFIAGEYENRAALFALSPTTLQTTFVGYVRPWASGVLVGCAAGPGSQVILIHSNEGVFIYDYLVDAISFLDYHNSDRTNSGDLTAANGIAAAFTYKGNRYFFTGKKGAATTLEATKWQHDYTAQSLGSTNGGTAYAVIEPEWDWGFIQGNKVPISFEAHFQPLGANDLITVSYLVEEAIGTNAVYGTFPSTYPNINAGAWSTLCTIDGSVDTGKTYKYITTFVSTPADFNKLRLRVELTKGSPVLLDCAMGVHVPPGQETWTVVLKLRDETPGDPRTGTARPTSRQTDASTLRSYVWTTARNKKVVTFKDGYPYRTDAPPKWDTYSVVIEDPQDTINENGQGSMKVTLRRVDVNSQT